MEHAFGMDIPRTLEEACDPAHLALLVYDMQAGILSQVAGGQPIIERVGTLIAAARQAGVRVFYSRHLSLPKEAAGASQLRMAMAWQKADAAAEVTPWFLRDAPGFQLIPELSPLPSEVVFDKITMSAFEGTFLGIALRDCGITALAVAGIAMEIGIEPTVRHAVDLGYLPIVVTDACGAGHPEAAQRSLASLAFAGDALLADTEAVCAALLKERM